MPLLNKYKNVKKKIKIAVLKRHFPLMGIVLLSLFLRLLWLYTLIEGDEGIYGYNAMLWLQGHLPYVDFTRLDSTPTCNKTPLLYFLYLIPIYFFGNTIIPVRIINNVLFLASVIVLYVIAKDWYGKRAGLIAALFYGIFMNVPVFQAQQAMSEPLSVPFVIFSIYFCNKYLRNGGRNRLFISGILISIACLTRQTQAFGIFALPLMLALFSKDSHHAKSKNKLNFARILAVDVLVLSLGIILPALFFIIYFWINGALNNLIECTVFSVFTDYLSKPDVPFGVKFLIIAEGLPLWLFSIFGFILGILRHNKRDIILMGWMLFFLPKFFMPPNYGHNYVQIIPQASILSAISLVPILDNITKLRTIRKFRDYEHGMATVFVVTVLVISFVPSIFLQIKQYPNLDINWGFTNWNFGASAGPWTYEKQLELGNYLKYNVSENGQILIHGWLATPYWLSGRTAPSKYILTVRDPQIFAISDEEFQRLTAMVKDGVFECIVGFAPDLQRLEWRRYYDPIINYTFPKYFFVKNISFAHIFSKYNSNGEFIDYVFLEHFPDAVKEYKLQDGTIRDTEKDYENEPIFIPKLLWLNISGDARYGIWQHPIFSAESYIRYKNVSILSGSKLKFGVGTDPASWYKKGGDGVQFKIYIENDKEVDEIFSVYIYPKQNITDRKWNDYELDLKAYGGKNVDIIFVTNPGPENNVYEDWAYWSDPKIYVKK